MEDIEVKTKRFEDWLQENEFPPCKIKICNSWEDSDERGVMATEAIQVNLRLI